MWNEIIETRGHTDKDGTLNLTVKVGVVDTDVKVTVQVRTVNPPECVDTNGWTIDFFERVAGSMPDLQRAPQGEFENRLAFD